MLNKMQEITYQKHLKNKCFSCLLEQLLDCKTTVNDDLSAKKIKKKS